MNEKFKKNIWKIYTFKFCISLYFIDGVLIPFFTMWGQITFTQIMILQAWYMFWVFILEIPSGTIADYLGRKQTLILASISHIFAVLIYTSMPLFFIFLIGEFIWALAESLISGTGHAFIYDSLKMISESETEKSKVIFGRFESFGLIGYIVSAPIGSLLAAVFDLRAPMLFMAFPFMGAIFIALSFREPRTIQSSKKKEYLQIMKKGVKLFYSNKVLKILAYEMISIGAIAFLMLWIYQAMLIQLKINIIYFGIIQALIVGSELIVLNSFKKLEHLLRSKRRYLLFSGIITGAMVLIAGLSFTCALITPMIIAIILVIAFGMTRTPLLISYMNKYIPSEERTTVLSTINMFQTLTFVIAYPLVGLAVDWSLNLTVIILGIVGISFSLTSRVKGEYLLD